jgi:hypothetical protein
VAKDAPEKGGGITGRAEEGVGSRLPELKVIQVQDQIGRYIMVPKRVPTV